MTTWMHRYNGMSSRVLRSIGCIKVLKRIAIQQLIVLYSSADDAVWWMARWLGLWRPIIAKRVVLKRQPSLFLTTSAKTAPTSVEPLELTREIWTEKQTTPLPLAKIFRVYLLTLYTIGTKYERVMSTPRPLLWIRVWLSLVWTTSVPNCLGRIWIR